MVSSISYNFLLSSAFFLTMLDFSISRVGYSNPTIMANIWSSNPEGVIAKFIIQTLTKVSGL